MAIYRLNVKVHSRGKSGKSALAIVSYRSEEKLKDEKLNRNFDYSKKNSCFHSEILLPSSADEKLKDRSFLWNEVEKVEKRKDAQLCREVVVALPKELELSAHREIVRNFCQKNFVSEGMICDVAIHNEKKGNNNFHAHILLSTREIDGVNFGKKNRAWNRQELLVKWREKWAETVNNELNNNDKFARIDHRTLKAQKEVFSDILPSNNNNTYRKIKNDDLPRNSGRSRKNESERQNVIKSPRLLHQKLNREQFASLLRQSFTGFQRRLTTAIFRAIRSRKEKERQEQERQAEARKRQAEAKNRRDEARERENRERQAEHRKRENRERQAKTRERQAEYRERESEFREREVTQREFIQFQVEARQREVEAKQRQSEATERQATGLEQKRERLSHRDYGTIPGNTTRDKGDGRESQEGQKREALDPQPPKYKMPPDSPKKKRRGPRF